MFSWNCLTLLRSPQEQSLRFYNTLNKELIEYIFLTRVIYLELEFLKKVIFICAHNKIISDSHFP